MEKNYINAFLESFLIYKAERFDVKGKNVLSSGYKYYCVDTGFRHYLLGKKADSDMGHILENIVYLELLRRGYKVYVGKVDELANTLQVCFDSGAKKILLPMSSASDISNVPSDLFSKFNISFYNDPEDAVYKALGIS